MDARVSRGVFTMALAWLASFVVACGGSSPGTSGPISSPGDEVRQASSGESAVLSRRDITSADSGRTFRYGLTSRFAVILDRDRYSEESFAVSCSSPGVIGGVTNTPQPSSPLYARAFQAVAPGKCEIRDTGFHITIEVVNQVGNPPTQTGRAG